MKPPISNGRWFFCAICEGVADTLPLPLPEMEGQEKQEKQEGQSPVAPVIPITPFPSPNRGGCRRRERFVLVLGRTATAPLDV